MIRLSTSGRTLSLLLLTIHAGIQEFYHLGSPGQMTESSSDVFVSVFIVINLFYRGGPGKLVFKGLNQIKSILLV